MWIHVLMTAGTLLIFAGTGRKWIRIPAFYDKQGRKLFLLTALAGNCLGLLLTWQSGSPVRITREHPLVRDESGVTESETLQATIGEETVSVPVQIPGQETQSREEESGEQMSEEESLRQQLEEEIVMLNRSEGDAVYYYLPEYLNGRRVLWERPGSTDGFLLAALAMLTALLLPLLKEREKAQEEERKREQMLMDYPNLVMKLTLLLQSGMTVRSAFHRIGGDYARRKVPGKERYAYEEILRACHEMESGVSEAAAYEHFGSRCGQIKYRTLSVRLVQNLQKGSTRLLEMLERESMEAFEDRKRRARVLGEAAATKLLVPMVLMLMVVLAIIMIPAVLSFYGS